MTFFPPIAVAASLTPTLLKIIREQGWCKGSGHWGGWNESHQMTLITHKLTQNTQRFCIFLS
jgi:hypothetical protein